MIEIFFIITFFSYAFISYTNFSCAMHIFIFNINKIYLVVVVVGRVDYVENCVDNMSPYDFKCGQICGKVCMVFHTFHILKWKTSYQQVINSLSTTPMWITNEAFP